MAKVAIIGSGMMGSALAFPILENGHEVSLIGTHLDTEIILNARKTGRHLKFEKDFPAGKINYYTIDEIEEGLKNIDYVICGVSSFGVEWFGEKILPILPENTVILSVTKGLMNEPDGTLITYVDYWKSVAEKLGKNFSFNAIGGPCTSYELVAHDQTEVAFCGDNKKTLEFLKKVMATDYYHISITDDVTGIESAVALKNGYALGIAITIGLNQKAFGLDSKQHFNSQAAVFYQSAKEMKKLLNIQGAREESYYIGVGDLYVTVYGGRTRLAGILLGRGLNIDEVRTELNGVTLESLVVAKRVAQAIKRKSELGLVDIKDFPLLMKIDKIISENAPAVLDWESYTYESFKN